MYFIKKFKKEMNQFNKLEPEIIEFIFKKVNSIDLMNLRMVDKRFKEICDQFRIKKLYVSNRKYWSYKDGQSAIEKLCLFYRKYWFYTNDPIYSIADDLIGDSKFLNFKSIFHLDKYLRRLSIFLNDGDEYLNCSVLNEFKLLEQLDLILNESISGHKVNFRLTLGNLKIARFQIPFHSRIDLTLDTIKLFAFKSNTLFFKVTFNYPDKILFYETEDYNDKIIQFKNLEYLKLTHLNWSTGRNLLTKLKNLKTLDINLINLSSIPYNFDINKHFSSIIEEKEHLKRSEFNVYLNGVKLINQTNQLKLYCRKFDYNVLKFQIMNYDLLIDNICYMEKIDYCDLIKLIKLIKSSLTIPSSFKNKFPCIHEVKANNYIDNEDQFIKFLNNLSYLSKLELINCGLTRSFYHKLVETVYLNNLEYLQIKENKQLNLNFDFISNLKQLSEFDTNQTIDNYIDLISKLIKVNKNIRRFIFKSDLENFISIICVHDNYLDIDKYEICFSHDLNDDENSKKIENQKIEILNLNDIPLGLKKSRISSLILLIINFFIFKFFEFFNQYIVNFQ